MAKARKIIAYNPNTDDTIMFPTVASVVEHFGISTVGFQNIIKRGLPTLELYENNYVIFSVLPLLEKMKGYELYYLEDFIEGFK